MKFTGDALIQMKWNKQKVDHSYGMTLISSFP